MGNNTSALFLPEEYYHVYSKTNNKEALFVSDENRLYFLDIVRNKLYGFVKILAFSLLDNHFHFCIKINSHTDIVNFIKSIPPFKRSLKMKQFIDNQDDVNLFDDIFYYLFSGIFNSYAQSFNKKESRKGNLFYKSFKRSLLDSVDKIQYNIYYIHHNARRHNLVIDFEDHSWHSYHFIVIKNASIVNINEVLSVFGDLNSFISFHKKKLLPKDKL